MSCTSPLPSTAAHESAYRQKTVHRLATVFIVVLHIPTKEEDKHFPQVE